MKKTFVSIILVLLVFATIIPAAAVTFPEDYVIGDVNKDGKVSSIDYILLKKFFQGISLDSAFEISSDVNNDGSVTSADYLIVKSIFGGNDIVLTYPKRLEKQSEINEASTNFNYEVSGAINNDMIFQRYKYISVYGTSDAVGRAVYATLGNETRYGIVDSDGHFEILLNARKENAKPETLYVYNKAEGIDGGKKFTGIMIGDVWIIAGQSNAQVSLGGTLVANPEFENTINSQQNIRMYTQWYWDCTDYYVYDAKTDSFVTQNGLMLSKGTPQDNTPDGTKWNTNTASNAKDFSAVGYYFAKKLADNTNVPIGIIQCVAGGAAIHNFMSTEGFDSSYVKGATFFKDNDIYNTLMHPFSKTNIKGMLFYQGESNCDSASTYASDLKDFVGQMRNIWGSDIEFYNVQLTSHGSAPSWGGLSDVRFAQYKAGSMIENYNIVTSMDYGYSSIDTDWAHPKTKKHVGDRLAYIALSKIYAPDKFSLEYYGCPEVDHIERDGTYAYIYFKNVGEGLKSTLGTKSVKGFQNYVTKANLSAEIISRDCVKINLNTSAKVSLCYGYGPQSDYTTDTLQNSNGIGALAFNLTVTR